MSGFVRFAAGAVAALATSGGAAQASTWVIDYTANNVGDTPFSAVVDVVASDVLNAVNGYDVLSVSGNVDGDVIDHLVPNPNQPTQATSPDGLFYYDNVVWPGAAQELSNPGILFTGVSGTEYNLFADDATHYELYTAVNGSWSNHSYGAITMAQTFNQGGFDRDTITGVPEPAAWALMILGFGGIGAVLRRRRAAFAAA